MTGVAAAATPAASTAPPPAPIQSDAATAAKQADVPAAPDAASPASGNGEVARPGPARTQATGKAQDGAPSTSVPGDFATLLLTGTDGSPVAASSRNAAAAAPPEEKSADAAGDAGGLPDQLLALLDGSWMKPPLQTDPAVAPALQMTPGTGHVAPASVLASSDRRPALDPAPLALAIQTDAAAASAGIAVTDALPAEGVATATTSDTNAPISSFPSIAAAMSNTPAARAIIAAPITVPSDPQNGFDDGFGARLVWMAEQRLGHAEIRLNPEHLGPIEVRVQMDGTQVSAEFQSGHASVRQAIEASLPRLREMLGQQGLQLGQTDVGQRHAGSGAPARRDGDASSQGTSPAGAQQPSRHLRTRGLLDEYA